VFGGLDIGFGFHYVRMINKTIRVDVVGSIGENFFLVVGYCVTGQ
jgi:hypothetical protein